MMSSKLFQAISVQVGTIIGAGIFALPYAISQTGVVRGLVYLAFCVLVVIIVNLAYSEIILRSSGDHQLTGYAQMYLGKWGKLGGSIALLAGSYGAMLAYMNQMGGFLDFLVPFWGNKFIYSLLIFGLGSLAVIAGLKRISLLESIIVPSIIFLIGTVIFMGLGQFRAQNLTLPGGDWSELLSYSGVILFALSGSSVIPEVEEVLREQRSLMKKAVIGGTLFPALLYFGFVLVIVGVSGNGVSEDAIGGLVPYLPSFVTHAGALLGLLTMFSSFLTLAFVIKEMFYRDFGLNIVLSWICSLLPPLLLFILGARSFIQILQISGGVMGGLTGILVLSIYFKAKGKGEREIPFQLALPEPLVWFLGLFFLIIVLRELGPLVKLFF